MGDLAFDTQPLSYKITHTGVARVWIREEVRKIPRKSLDLEASSIAVSKYGCPLQRLVRHEVEACRDEARRTVLSGLVPSVKILEGLAFDSWLFIGSRAPEAGLLDLVRSTFGEARIDPMAWGPSGSWSDTVSRLSSEMTPEGWVGPHLEIVEASFDGQGYSWAGTRKNAQFAADLRQAIDRCGSEGCREVTLCFWKGGEATRVGVDAEGVFKIEPPPSKGGLPAERVARRLRDAKTAAWAVAEALDVAKTED